MSTSIFKLLLLTSMINQQNSSNTPLTVTAIDPVEICLTDNTNSNVLQYRRDSSAAWQPYDGSAITLENNGDYVQFQVTDEVWLNTYKDEQTVHETVGQSGIFNFHELTDRLVYSTWKYSVVIKLCKLYYTILLFTYVLVVYKFMYNADPTRIRTDPNYNYRLQHQQIVVISICSRIVEWNGFFSAPELPATTLADCCYQYMFQNCISLTKAPALPATTLAGTCYYFMFSGCTSLTTAPELPATTLAYNCYAYMFNGCTSLTEAPGLPATTLVSYCYSNMFQGCTSLTSAPELPATTVAESCYSYMFNECTSLTLLKVGFTTWHADNTSNWVYNVSSAGTFICPAALPQQFGTSKIPEGWTVQTY